MIGTYSPVMLQLGYTRSRCMHMTILQIIMLWYSLWLIIGIKHPVIW